MGRVCFINPFFSTMVLGASCIEEAGNKAQKERYLPAIAEGKVKVTLALTEASASYAPGAIATRATYQNGHYTLQGRSSSFPTPFPLTISFVWPGLQKTPTQARESHFPG